MCANHARAIPDIPVFLNSPMAVNATRVFAVLGTEDRMQVNGDL